MSRRLQRGVSLIEALVAFAIMAFGMMAVVGMQGTMRGNADMARQRAEAVRLAQDSIEEWRGFSSIATTANRTAYLDVDGTSPPRDVVGTNATYTVARSALAQPVVVPGEGTVAPDRRGVMVVVTWTDRSNQAQLVRLTSTVAGLAPELSASLVLSTAADPVVAPQNRHRAIPPGAVGGIPAGVCINCSGYVPPGQTGGGDRVVWLFNNRTAEITVCASAATTSSLLTSTSIHSCDTDKALLLSGFVRQLPNGPPGVNAAADPAGPNRAFDIQVERTSPSSGSVPSCFQDAILPGNAVPYLCAISTSTGKWAGNVVFGSPLQLASSLSEPRNDRYKVCRYFGRPGQFGSSGQPDLYPNVLAVGALDIAVSLTNQNYLIMEGGSGSVPYDCPNDTPATLAHQPNS